MKVVINNCCGSFSLSIDALKLAVKRNAKGVLIYDEPKYFGPEGRMDSPFAARIRDVGGGYEGYEVGAPVVCLFKDGKVYMFNIRGDIKVRSDPILVDIVEELGDRASGVCAELKIVDVPDGVDCEITEEDGLESVEEKHRIWS